MKNAWAKELLLNNIEDMNTEEQLQYVSDVCQHGCVSGCVSGVIYYSETMKLFKDNMEEILEYLGEYEEEHGWNPLDSMEDVSTFYNWAVWFVVEAAANDLRYELSEEIDSLTDFDIDITEELANILGIDEEELRLWSDNSITLEDTDDYEFIFSKVETDKYSQYLGEFNGLHLYNNGCEQYELVK
ncbi:hypothetical protein CPT_Mater228 [Bacillus phage Mater]|uniref:DUF7222 domain-containing protein n=1 Tax=Bacillus phage Mater TaxID=1540090 RepID=A0A0A0RMU1_9CAUD|nr:hypothetical protein CPT_Mater6 [Bacillus phage Mater]YP_009151187.1 hypothetical protein CPT_Mater228 [Bacillus phage Mater]AIW03163.1 hypothetical protein CPT_Mater6 [Bacillus phage Mater]AIW03385.1 hypothetical protein CPT_Mater228 [Bacillus phage Mater]